MTRATARSLCVALLVSVVACSGSGTIVTGDAADSAPATDSDPAADAGPVTDAGPLDCGPLPNGQSETRTFYDVPSVPAGESCAPHAEQRTRTCTDGVLSNFSGSFPYESCLVRDPNPVRPIGDLLENYVLQSGFSTVSGVGANLSGVTWDAVRGRYVAVINDASAVGFLSPAGNQIVPTDTWTITNRPDFGDHEGVSWIEDDIFVFSDERNDRAVFVRVQPGNAIDLDNTLFTINFPTQAGSNAGLEGISFVSSFGQCGALFAVQETPYELYRFVLPCTAPGVIDMSADIDHSQTSRTFFRLPGFGQSMLRNCYWTGSACDANCTTCDKIDIQDFAGITYVPATGRVIIVSENVGIKRGGVGTTELIDVLVEIGPNSNADWAITWITELPQHQAEGVTIGENNELIVVSEPNLVLRLLVP